MPTSPALPCSTPGCRHRKPCPDHAARHEPIAHRRGSASSRGYGAPWRKLRMMVLREEPLCRRCGNPASEVDHRVPKEQGGDDTRDNLQALCKPCHSTKTVTEDRGFKTGISARASIAVVCGPPGSGKSTYVRDRAKWGDLIVDVDALYQALSGLPAYEKPEQLLPFVCSARDAVVDRLLRQSAIARAWIVATMPKKLERDLLRRRLGAKVIVIETGTEDCMKRIGQDYRRAARAALWRGHVERWWSDYERDERDVIASGNAPRLGTETIGSRHG